MRLRYLIPAPAARLWGALEAILDHLRGKNRIDFRRLFLATTLGRRCWELDRSKVLALKPKHLVTDREDGYWMPRWTWPIIVQLFRHDHLSKVRDGKESRIDSVLMPPGARKDGELLDPTKIVAMQGELLKAFVQYARMEMQERNQD